jgi:hypothetical protein
METTPTFNALMAALNLKALVPSSRPVLYLLTAPRPLAPIEGALVCFRPEPLWRYRAASGVLVSDPDGELVSFAKQEGLGVAYYPPWLKRDELEAALGARLFALGAGMALAGVLELLMKLPERPMLELLHQSTQLALAHVAPWGELLAFAGPVPAQHPGQPGSGPGYLALAAGEGLLVAYGEVAALQRARGLLEVAARLLRVQSLERGLERLHEESLGGALLEGLILGEAEPERLFAFGFVEGVEWRLALIEAPQIAGHHRLAEVRRREATLALRRAAGGYLERLGIPYLLGVRGNRVAALWQVHSPEREAHGLLQALPEGSRLGHSATHARPEVPQAYREALIALKAARAGEALAFGGLDPVAFVLLQQSPEDLRALTERYLPLSAKLLRTLEVYLSAPSQEAAAAQLHIHPNTLRYRLRRIEAAVGPLSRPETAARLHLALRARELLAG